VKKNPLGGLLITSTIRVPRLINRDQSAGGYLETETQSVNKDFVLTGATRIEQMRCFSQITVDTCTAYQNFKFGVAVRCFYGLVHMINTVCSENEGHGIVLSGKATNKSLAT
jgi:hypothetical protein